MCVVSMIGDYYQPKFPKPEKTDIEKLREIMDLIEKAREYDELNKQPDCVKPEFDEWVRDIEERLEKIEKKLV